jgi:hypothetical protein
MQINKIFIKRIAPDIVGNRIRDYNVVEIDVALREKYWKNLT